MEHRARDVTVRHLQRIVQPPQRRREAVADAREAPARRRVRLEHQELLALRLDVRRGVEVRRDERLRGGVVQVGREHGLGVAWGADAELGVAVVTWVAGKRWLKTSRFPKSHANTTLTVPQTNTPDSRYTCSRSPCPIPSQASRAQCSRSVR